MRKIKHPYISRVRIKNFRNFLDVDVQLDHKQVVLGENNVGKTNFLRAIQLILDRELSDNDRQLTTDDFHDSLIDPMENGEEIEVILDIRGYEHSRKLVAQFDDAIISDSPPTLQFTYRFFPLVDTRGNIAQYTFEIYKGISRDVFFTNEDRSFINIHVIKALRDVDRELKASKKSPLYRLVKQYDVSKDMLEDISAELKDAALGITDLDEVKHIRGLLSERFIDLSGVQSDNDISLRTFDIETERLLYSLQVYMGIKERPISELSLGLANILYISLMLLLIRDRTVLPIIKVEKFEELLEYDDADILSRFYEKSNQGNYILISDISLQDYDLLYKFMDVYNFKPQSFTILAIEEPEAHLHPVLQRLIYRQVLHESETSVIFTTHSTFIASVAPLKSIVYIKREHGSSTILSTFDLRLEGKEIADIERYIDAKRGEIYFGKGVVLVEGITEEYIVPSAASILGKGLDEYGIVVCNIDSTNFKPFVLLLKKLRIPWVIFTDGDYYKFVVEVSAETGKETKVRKYHVLSTNKADNFRGHEIITDILEDLDFVSPGTIPDDASEQESVFESFGCFVGFYTLEVDMMDEAGSDGIELIKSVYSELVEGGQKMRENFNFTIDGGDYWGALTKIESNISKGRFAQRLAGYLTEDLIPEYIEDGIKYIVDLVNSEYEC